MVSAAASHASDTTTERKIGRGKEEKKKDSLRSQQGRGSAADSGGGAGRRKDVLQFLLQGLKFLLLKDFLSLLSRSRLASGESSPFDGG